MRILCLHGRGSNNEIFKMQTAGFRSLLPDYEFDFVQGQMPHVEGNWSLHTKDFASSKLWGYFNLLDPQDVLETEREVLRLAEEEGPYDGILGYSQGATLAAQALIRHSAETEQGHLLFKFAVFFNAATPSRVFEVTDAMRPLNPVVPGPEDEPMALKFLTAMKANPLLGKTKLFLATLADSGRRVLTDGTLAMAKCEVGLDGTLITMPTLHARCATDEPEHGQELYELCEPTVAKQYFHTHKHDFPRGYEEMRRIAKLIQETAELGTEVVT